MDILNMDKNVTKVSLFYIAGRISLKNWRSTKSSKLSQATDNLSVTKKGIYSVLHNYHSLEELVAFQLNHKREE